MSVEAPGKEVQDSLYPTGNKQLSEALTGRLHVRNDSAEF